MVMAMAAMPPVGTAVNGVGGVELGAVTVIAPSEVDDVEEPQPVSTTKASRRQDATKGRRGMRARTALRRGGSTFGVAQSGLPFMLVIASLSSGKSWFIAARRRCRSG
jgi:hypothetical protein